MAVQMTLKYEPLLIADIERDRLKLAMECCIITPNVLKDGLATSTRRVCNAASHRGAGLQAAATAEGRCRVRLSLSAAAERPDGEVTQSGMNAAKAAQWTS